MYRCRSNTLVSVEDSSGWMKSGNNKPRTEANLRYIQDRNVFWGFWRKMSALWSISQDC